MKYFIKLIFGKVIDEILINFEVFLWDIFVYGVIKLKNY